MNKCTVALTTDQYKEIISTMKRGFTGSRPNEPIATALMLEANLGLRISDVLRLRLYQFIRCYCLDNGLSEGQRIFPMSERSVQRHLKLVCDYLGYTGISTHSFRKYYATEIYKNSGYNIALVQQLLQHSSTAVTQRYIGIQQQEVEKAIERHLILDV